MKQKLIASALALCMCFLTACNLGITDTSTQEEIIVEATPLRDFMDMHTLPKAESKQPIERISKLAFSEARETPGEASIVVDIANRAMYSRKEGVIEGIDEPDIPLTKADITKLLDILVRYDVQSWDEDYSSASSDILYDVYAWGLQLEYDDRTVKTHYGSGPIKEEIIPENYEAFVEELLAFRDAKIARAR
jgi:hypothetical protein